jgi:hypothetical protein
MLTAMPDKGFCILRALNGSVGRGDYGKKANQRSIAGYASLSDAKRMRGAPC